MSEQAPFNPNDPSQGQLFTEHTVTTIRNAQEGVPATMDETQGYLDYNGLFENGIPANKVEGVKAPETSITVTQNIPGAEKPGFGFSVSGNETKAVNLSELPPPPTSASATEVAAQPVFELGFASRLNRISNFFEKYANKSENAYQKARRFVRGVGSTAVATGQAFAEVGATVYAAKETVKDKALETWVPAGETNAKRVGNLSLRAIGMAHEQIFQPLQEKAEDKVIDLVAERKKRRQQSAPTPARAYPSRPSTRAA